VPGEVLKCRIDAGIAHALRKRAGATDDLRRIGRPRAVAQRVGFTLQVQHRRKVDVDAVRPQVGTMPCGFRAHLLGGPLRHVTGRR